MRSIFVAFVLCALLAQAFAVSSAVGNNKPAPAAAKKSLEPLERSKPLAQTNSISIIFTLIQQIIELFLQIFGLGNNITPIKDNYEVHPAPTLLRSVPHNMQFYRPL